MLMLGSITRASTMSRWSDVHSSTLFFISPLPAQSYVQWHLFVLCIFNIRPILRFYPMSSPVHWPCREAPLKKPQVWCFLFGGSSLSVTDLVSVLPHKLCWQFHTHELTHRSAKKSSHVIGEVPRFDCSALLRYFRHLLYLSFVPTDSTETSL